MLQQGFKARPQRGFRGLRLGCLLRAACCGASLLSSSPPQALPHTPFKFAGPFPPGLLFPVFLPS
eukprot:315481-Chlamydomonas_euryale.AAC.1